MGPSGLALGSGRITRPFGKPRQAARHAVGFRQQESGHHLERGWKMARIGSGEERLMWRLVRGIAARRERSQPCERHRSSAALLGRRRSFTGAFRPAGAAGGATRRSLLCHDRSAAPPAQTARRSQASARRGAAAARARHLFLSIGHAASDSHSRSAWRRSCRCSSSRSPRRPSALTGR